MVHSPGEIALYQRKLNKKVWVGFFKFYSLFYILASGLDLGLICML